MLAPILFYFKLIFLYFFYVAGWVTSVISVLKKPKYGVYAYALLILQPNIWYKLMQLDLPFGKDFLDLIFLGTFIGVIVRKNRFRPIVSYLPILLLILSSFWALWNVSFNFSLPLPVSYENPIIKPWKNYVMMIMGYYIVQTTLKEQREQELLVRIMAVVVLFICLRSYRSFTAGASFVDESRVAGPFWIVGLGSNHFAALIAYMGPVFAALYFNESAWKWKLLFLATVVLSVFPLFFCYSRGAYVASFVALVLFGLFNRRILLVLVIALVIAWQSFLPPSVVERIEMTTAESGQLESSAAARLKLWDQAMNLFWAYPLSGAGFNAFALAHQGEHWADTHNYFLKKLSEEGVIGLTVLCIVLLVACGNGIRLWRSGDSPFHRALGFGFVVATISLAIVNCFGDRFSYIELGTYYWMLYGLVDSSLIRGDSTSNGQALGEIV